MEQTPLNVENFSLEDDIRPLFSDFESKLSQKLQKILSLKKDRQKD